MGERRQVRSGRRVNLLGQRFGNLLVIDAAPVRICGKDNRVVTFWLCQCDCGNITEAATSNLTRGKVLRCNPCGQMVRGASHATHRLTKTRIYKIWCNMKDRCYRQKQRQFKRYGGRGIIVCQEWLKSFEAFYEWAMGNGYKEDLTLDRINNDGNYEPSNCRWATYFEQNQNKTGTILIDMPDGNKETVSEACRKLNVTIRYGTVMDRMKRGWDFWEAISKPLEVHKQKLPISEE